MSKKKVLLRGVFINRDTNGEGVLKVGTTLIRVSTVMGILYIDLYKDKIDGWKALELLNRPSEMCSYCAETPQEFEWDIKSDNDAKAEDWFVEE